MLATPGTLPAGTDWLFEVKWDGMRVLADVSDGRVRLTDRGGREVTASFPELDGLTRLAPDVLLDGEVVLLEGGVPSFRALTDRMHEPVDPRGAHARPVTFTVFDVLRLYGVPLLERPLGERRATLERLGLDTVSRLSLSPDYPDGAALFDATLERGMAGVLAKHRDGVYRPGVRSPDWVATTHRPTLACLVGGWRPEHGGGWGAGAGLGGGGCHEPTGQDSGRIGALLLGLPGMGRLWFAGSVEVGHADTTVQRVLRGRLVDIGVSPFGAGMSRSAAAGARWCRPSTVVEVAHRGWTARRLREPVFRGIRDDLGVNDLAAPP